MSRSLFIGRWQPMHDGHKALINSVLQTGKKVCIAIRDTEISKDNPYSATERIEMIRGHYPDTGLVEIVVIPDIDEVCYGRGVGYGIREIKLDKSIENISATDIREHNDNLDNRE